MSKQYIFITEIKVSVSSHPYMNFKSMHDIRLSWSKDYLSPADDMMLRQEERVKAHSFRNDKGDRIYLGLTKQAEDMLGLPMEAFENMGNEIEALEKKLSIVRSNYVLLQSNILKMTFWDRLKFLFSGDIK